MKCVPVICALNLHETQCLSYLLSINEIKSGKKPYVAATSNNWLARKCWGIKNKMDEKQREQNSKRLLSIPDYSMSEKGKLTTK